MKPDFTQGRWGYAYKNGKLYHFTDRHILVMRGGEQPLAWLKRRSHDWRPDRKYASETLVDDDKLFWSTSLAEYLKPNIYFAPALEDYKIQAIERNYDAVAAFRSSFPEEMFKEVRRYGSRRWNMLCLFSRCPNALDLSISNPALAFALASNWAFHQPKPTKPIRAARSLVFQKQKKILAWLGFPGTERVRRIFRKLFPENLSVELLLLLRAALKIEDNRKLLAHLPAITPSTISLMAIKKIRPYLGDKFFHSLLDKKQNIPGNNRKQLPFLLLDTFRMLEAIPDYRFPGPFTSIAEVVRTHDRLMNLQLKQAPQSLSQLKFPPAPFAGTKNIEPITTAADLHAEGLQQRHCCFSFAKKVAQGDLYFYKIMQPLRATLLIKRKENRWIFQEIRKADNKLVPDEDRKAIVKSLFLSGNCRDSLFTHNQKLLSVEP
ncbi:PcfJ domain-containing protein [Thiovibrio sp. JS02]